MFSNLLRNRNKLFRRLSGLAVACAAVVMTTASVSANAACRTVNGNFNILPVANCPSPVGVCGQGTFLGGILGNYFSPFTSIVPTADTATTGVVLYTADISVTNAQVGDWTGNLNLKEGGAFHTAGSGEFAALFSAAGGTGSFANANGVLSVTGAIDLATGSGQGVYSGQICAP